MRILLTTRNVGWVGGVQLFIRDLGRKLLERGHEPVVYSVRHDPELEHLRSWTIPVIDDLARLGEPPDLIHANDILGTMTALMRYPNVPAVFFSHGWSMADGAPPKSSRILRYVGVDLACRDRLVHECGIPLERTSLLFNFVDLDRFHPRSPLPERPRRALLFGNEFRHDESMKRIRRVCQRNGIELQIAGAGVAATVHEPEALLREFDIVFGRGRCAQEAMAVGNAVILQGYDRIFGMVTSENFDRVRPHNFGLRALEEELTEERIEQALAAYDAEDAAAVRDRIRSLASVDQAADQAIALYEEILEQARRHGPFEPEQERIEFSNYLRSLDLRNSRRRQPPDWLTRHPRLRSVIRSTRRLLGLI